MTALPTAPHQTATRHSTAHVLKSALHSWALRYFVSRVAQGVLVIFGAVTISFFLISTSGNVVDALRINPLIKTEQIAQLKAELGLDKPVMERYFDNLVAVVHGDFGSQFGSGVPAKTLVLDALPNTALLLLAAIAIAWPVATAVSVFSVLRRGTRTERVVRQGVVVLQGVPEFWAALVLVLIFSVRLQWFPSFGFTAGVRSLVLPAVALSIPLMPVLVRLMRGQLLDFMASDLATGLRGRGLSPRRLVMRHGLPNVLVPTINFLSLQLGSLLGGAVVCEVVFGWPGIGQLLLTSVEDHEVAVAQAVVVISAIGIVAVNFIADVLTFIIDPRVRRAQ